jgi:hypothetical protein
VRRSGRGRAMASRAILVGASGIGPKTPTPSSIVARLATLERPGQDSRRSLKLMSGGIGLSWRRSICLPAIGWCSTRCCSTTQVADPFHVVKLANTALDESRRRIQNETLGHRGRKDDPKYRSLTGHPLLDPLPLIGPFVSTAVRRDSLGCRSISRWQRS